MNLISYFDSPFQIQLSFHKVIDDLAKTAADNSNERSGQAKRLLEQVLQHPELYEGITDEAQTIENEEIIKELLVDYFPPALTENEIKAVNIPYTNISFNHTARLKKILSHAGPDFDMTIRDLDQHQFFINSCCLILNEYYGTKLDFGKPMFYDIPTEEAVLKHYRILYNGDFLEVLPTDNSVKLTPEDVDELLNNYDNLALWKEKFPEGSWLIKGFAILTLFDATVENAVSLLKEKLLALNVSGLQASIESIFRSIYRIPDIEIGFMVFNAEENKFGSETFGRQMLSYVVEDGPEIDAVSLLGDFVYKKVVTDKLYFAVSDVQQFLVEFPGNKSAQRLLSQKVHSFILAPIVKNNILLGVVEVVSFRPKELNSINAHRLEVVIPFLTDTVERLLAELENHVQAIIQANYTAIHNSVYWKFRDEAQRYIFHEQQQKEYTLKEVTFPDVYPLYGQVDIKGSSDARNLSIQKDLQEQLKMLLAFFEDLKKDEYFCDSFKEEKKQLQKFYTELESPLRAATEQYINDYLQTFIHPVLQQIKQPERADRISKYFAEVNKLSGYFHSNRRKYEKSISLINNMLADIIDYRQKEAQEYFPHYFERFKTDGVEHNLYIGPSVSPKKIFSVSNLHNLRIWQLRVLCEMENAHYHVKNDLPYHLEVTTLLLTFHSPIAIRFRMDEKRFDVDGSYNARFEIVKKRIDKAHVKNTYERIAQTGKLCIVYFSDTEEKEYIYYIKLLQSENILEDDIELLEVEDLQGISGLKALRVKIKHE
jgi:hypothetical protein